MLALTLALTLLQNSQVDRLNSLAQAKNVTGLTAELGTGAYTGRNPFKVFETGGAYGVGRFGWNALNLTDPDSGERFVVFSTIVTSEDVADLVFQTDGTKLTKYIHELEDNGWSILKHDMKVSFDLPASRAILSDTITVQAQGEVRPLMIRIGSNYKIKSIKDQNGSNRGFSQAGGTFIVSNPQKERDMVLTLEYEGKVDKPQYAGSVSSGEAMLTNDYWYPMIARKPAPYEVEVTAPKAWTTVGQGELVSVKEVGNDKVTRYKMDMPAVYYSLATGPYRMVMHKDRNDRRFTIWSKTLTEDQMRIQNELFVPILEFFDKNFTKYPFTGYGALVTPLYGGGALEAYSYATYGFYPGEEVHEPAHTWFGGIINNTYLRSFWNESFAVFLEGFYQRETPIGNQDERREAFIQTPDNNPRYREAPLANAGADIGPAASDLGYGKGAFVLQMLEQEIGTKAMLESMQTWLKDHDPMKPGEWEHYEAAVDKVTGKSYKWFFDQWLRRTAWADFEIQNVRWTGSGVEGTVQWKSEPYRIKSEVMFEYADGKREFKSVELPSKSGEKFTVALDREPEIVSVDPWRRLMRRFNDNEEPLTLATYLPNLRRYQDNRTPQYLTAMRGGRRVTILPQDLDGLFIIGHPSTTGRMSQLCEKVGFKVDGNRLTFRGTTIDLTKGGAISIVELGDGKRCAIGLGQIRHAPTLGRTKTILFDDLGRFQRGVSEPKTNGFLTFRL